MTQGNQENQKMCFLIGKVIGKDFPVISLGGNPIPKIDGKAVRNDCYWKLEIDEEDMNE